MFCQNCGKPINENEKFCSECGQPVSGPTNTDSQAQAPQKKKKGRSLLFFLPIFVFILLLPIAILLDKDEGSDSSSISKTVQASADGYFYAKLPTYFMDNEELGDWRQNSGTVTDGFTVEVTNDYVVVKMSPDKYEEFKLSYKTNFDNNFNSIISSSKYETIKKIEYSDDCSKATVKVTSAYLSSDDSIGIREIGNQLSQCRALFFDDYEARIEITIKDESDNTIDTLQYKHPTERALEATAKNLVSAYSTNEIAANNKYGGKYVKITGIVDSIGRDITDSIYITLSDGDDFSLERVQCFFSEKYSNEIAPLTKGTEVVVYGTCDDYLVNVLVTDCVLTSN